MACPKNGPCTPYVTELDLCCLSPSGTLPDPCLTSGQPVPQDVIDSSIEAASELLWALTGRQFGTCSVKIRPCNKDSLSPCPDGGEIPWVDRFPAWGSAYPWYPAQLSNGLWTNISACATDCCAVCDIPLPFPTCSVDEVKINGEVLLDTQYRVDEFEKLVYLWEYGPEEVEGAFMFTSVAGEYCTSPAPTSYQFGVENSPGCADGGVYRTFGEGAAPNPSSITLTYTDEFDGGPTSGFGFSHPTLGFYTWPENDTPMALGETRKSDILIDGDGRGHYITYTYVSGPEGAGPAASNPNQNLQSSFWDVNSQEPRTVLVEFFGPVTAGCWPSCQNFLAEDTEDDTFSVTVTYGRPVPELVKLATAKLACELILSCVGQPCSLPQRVQNITRQGLQMTLIDPQTFLKDGYTGIYLVDQAIMTYNPRKLQRRASVYSVDLQPRWRRTTG